MNADLLLFIPLLYTLYAFIRLGVDQQIIWREYERIKSIFPNIADELGQPVSILNAWQWMRQGYPEWLNKHPSLLDSYQNIQQRLRRWNFQCFPTAIALWLIFGILHAVLTQ